MTYRFLHVIKNVVAFDRATIGGVVDRLVAKGFVARRINPKDRRARILDLTNDGKQVLAQMHPVVQKSQEALLPSMPANEKKEFIRLAAKITSAGNKLSRAPLYLPEGTPPAN